MATFHCKLGWETFCGWNAVKLSNGLLELYVVPEIGGRILQLRLAERELLYVNSRHLGHAYSPDENCAAAGWKNYGGSKVWPAPQGWEREDQWPGPPDPILDGGPYSLEVTAESPESVAVRLESRPDSYSGLTLAREIRLRANSSSVEIIHMMRNCSARTVRWGIWQVTQQDARRGLVAHVRATRHRQMFGDRPFDNVHLDSNTHLWTLNYADQVAKFAVEAEQGWIVAVRAEEMIALVETFPLFPGRRYPDGAPVELWVNGRGTFTLPTGQVDSEADPNGCDPYVETEILSPLVELEPGEEFTFPIAWHATQACNRSVAEVTEAALVSVPLRAVPERGQVRVTGSFGVFQTGLLELDVVTADGRSLAAHQLGEVSPSSARQIDHRLVLPAKAVALKLFLKNSDGRMATELAEARLEEENASNAG
jgi:hypothetical protein